MKLPASSLPADRGSVESALVMIPTVLLFLTVLQICSAVLTTAVATNQVQGKISRVALYGSLENTTDFRVSRQPLSGGGYVLTGVAEQSLPILSPLLLGDHRISTTEIAVDENW